MNNPTRATSVALAALVCVSAFAHSACAAPKFLDPILSGKKRPAHWVTKTVRIPVSKLPRAVKLSGASVKVHSAGKVNQGGGGIKLADPNHMDSATTVDEWFQKMPEWGLINPKLKPKNDKKETALPNETEGGREYRTTKVQHSITETPSKIATYSPVDGFWLGGLVQQRGLSEGIGSMAEIPIPDQKRAPFTITTDLPGGNNYRDIPYPSNSAVNAKIGELMEKNNHLKFGAVGDFKVVENYSMAQTAHEIGIDLRYGGSTLTASLDTKGKRSEHTVTAAFIQRAFTANVDFKGNSRRKAFFSDKFTIADARNLKTLKKVSATNLPTYVKSITYGRIVLFNLTSTASESEIQAAVAANIQGGAWKVGTDYNYAEDLKNKHFQVQITAFGGPSDSFSTLVPATGIENVFKVMHDYLSAPAPLTSMKPISYTVNTLRDDQLAEMSTTTEYTVTKYSPEPIGARYKLKMWLEVTSAKDAETNGDDHEAYGDLMINGDTKWTLRNLGKNSRTVDKGELIKITEDPSIPQGMGDGPFALNYYDKEKTPYNFRLVMKDWDKHSANDEWFRWEGNLDLKAAYEKAQKNPSKELIIEPKINGNGGGRLHIRMDRIGYL